MQIANERKRGRNMIYVTGDTHANIDIGKMERAVKALDKFGWTVDYVVTHCAPRSVQTLLSPWYKNDPAVSFLERVRTDLKFKRWYFGHYHETF